jgi:hypothetical protein
MKKIENLLLLPFLFTIYGINRISIAALMIKVYDDGILIAPSIVCTWFLCYVLVLFALYKLIRMRQRDVNQVWAIGHITITSLLIVTVWAAFEYADVPVSVFSLTDPGDFAAWASYNKPFVFSALIFALVQVVFWIYFTVKMVKAPGVAKPQYA